MINTHGSCTAADRLSAFYVVFQTGNIAISCTQRICVQTSYQLIVRQIKTSISTIKINTQKELYLTKKEPVNFMEKFYNKLVPANFLSSNKYCDAIMIAGIVLFTMLIRLVSLEYVEIGGDSLFVWENAVSMVQNGHYLEWNHHNMRWAIGLPLDLLLNIFGTAPLNYYILPVLFSVLASILAYLLGKELGDRKFAAFFAVLLVLYPKMTTSGSQLWPGIYEMTYLLACVCCLFIWRRKGGWHFLAAAGLLSGCVWGSRITGIYYAPGLLALLLFDKKKLWPVLIFSAFFLSVLGLEWTYFYSDSGNVLGRLGILASTHISQDQLLLTFSDYLLNFTNLIKFRGLLPVVIAALGIGIWVLRKGNSNEKSIAILFLGGLFFNIYMISSISPLKIAAPVGSRYLTAGVPFMLLTILIGIKHWHKHSPKYAVIVKWVLLVAFLVFTLKEIPAQNSLSRLQEDVNSAQIIEEQGLPVIMRYNAWTPNAIESAAMSLTGYEPKNRLKINEDDKMRRNGHRMKILLFGQNTDKNYRPQSIDGYYYLFNGDLQDLAKGPKIGLSDFDRKGHKLVIIDKKVLPFSIP
ncbi:glycosyltransferase family 39 protein [Maridesulfovibrio frigidus]|uniref:glycosyltransferase family 39 protein n=1 Tax=Maridesulfovibrio frigidus TaxID=340956 RepID=UPI0004E19B7E|nr:glycosyltransferase family 39 protein [Maridesulfovibrio frigidus]